MTMKIFLLLMTLIVTGLFGQVSGSAEPTTFDKRRSRADRQLDAYVNPNANALIRSTKNNHNPLKRILKYIQSIPRNEDTFFEWPDDNKMNLRILKILEKLEYQDYQNVALVESLLQELDPGDYAYKILIKLPLKSKIDILQVFIKEIEKDLLDHQQYSYRSLNDDAQNDDAEKFEQQKNQLVESKDRYLSLKEDSLGSEKGSEKIKKDDEKFPPLSSEYKVNLSGFEDEKNNLLEYLEKIKIAKEKLQEEEKFLGTDSYKEDDNAQLTKEIQTLEEHVSNIWRQFLKKFMVYLNKGDIKNILDLVAFLFKNEPPQDILEVFLASLNDMDRYQIAQMSLVEKSELLYDGLKNKIAQKMPKLTLFGYKKSYERLLLEADAYPEGKGMLLEAAIDANDDWQNVVVIEYIMRSFMQGTDSEATYDDIANIAWKDKVRFLKNTYLGNIELYSKP